MRLPRLLLRVASWVVILSVVFVSVSAGYRLFGAEVMEYLGLADKAEPENGAGFFPPDTLAYGWLNLAPAGKQGENMRDLWKRVRPLDGFDDEINKIEDASDGLLDMDGITRWAGRSMSVGVLKPKGENGEWMDGVVLIVEVRDEDEAEMFITKRGEYVKDAPSVVAGEEQRGEVALWQGPDDVVALSEDWLVLTTSLSALNEVLDRIEGRITDGGLEAQAGFMEARSHLVEERALSLYLDNRGVGDEVRRELEPFGMSRGLFSDVPPWVALSGVWLEDGVLLEAIALEYENALTRHLEPEILAGDPGQLVPGDALVVLGWGYDPVLDNLRSGLSEMAVSEVGAGLGQVGLVNPSREGSSLADALDAMLSLVNLQAGIDVEEELVGQLSGNGVAVLSPGMSTEIGDVAILLSYKPEAEELLRDSIETVLDRTGWITGMEYESREGSSPFWVAKGEEDVALAMWDGWLLAGSTESLVQGIIDVQTGHESSLAMKSEYQRLRDVAGAHKHLLGYADVGELLSWYRDEQDDSPEGIGIAEQVIGKVLLVDGWEDGVSKVTVVVAVSREIEGR